MVGYSPIMAQEGNRRVFFAWQSDTKSEFNKNLIWDALNQACKTLSDEAELGPDREDIRADRDTQGVAGSGDIHRIIFDKLERTDLALFDLTAVARTDGGKPIPNPNVMLELGFATRAIGESRIALVANSAAKHHGDLPFDLRNRRIIFYKCTHTDHVVDAKQSLTTALTDALRQMSLAMPARAIEEPTVLTALREGRQGSRDAARREARRLANEVVAQGPGRKLLNQAELVESLKVADPYLSALLAMVDVCLAMEQFDVLVDIVEWALEALVKASTPEVGSGTLNERWVDYERTLTREFFLGCVSICVRHRAWEPLRRILLHKFEYSTPTNEHRASPLQRIWLYPSYVRSNVSPYLEVMKSRDVPAGQVRPTFEELRDAEMLVALFDESEIGDRQKGAVGPWLPFLVLTGMGLTSPIEKAATSTKTVRDLMSLMNRDWQSLNTAYAQLKARLITAFNWSTWSYRAEHAWPKEIARE